MADEMRSGGVDQHAPHSEIQPQALELKRALPLNIYIGMEYASYIQSAIVFGNSAPPQMIKGFYRTFWHVYYYVKGAVDAEKLNPDLIEGIDLWFQLMMGQHRNTKLILIGVEFYLEFVKNMQEWGIGRLFEKGIDPAFVLEDLDNFEMLIEEPLKEAISIESLEASINAPALEAPKDV